MRFLLETECFNKPSLWGGLRTGASLSGIFWSFLSSSPHFGCPEPVWARIKGVSERASKGDEMGRWRLPKLSNFHRFVYAASLHERGDGQRGPCSSRDWRQSGIERIAFRGDQDALWLWNPGQAGRSKAIPPQGECDSWSSTPP